MEDSQQQQVVEQIERATPCHAVLSAGEAWAIANEFRTGRVDVAEDKSAPMSVIKSYEWVTLNCDSRMDSTESDEAAARRLGEELRALCVTWTLLSRCPGYGGEENPAFWKLVLDNQPSIDEMTDAVRFFRHNAFPSFKLCKMNRWFSIDDLTGLCRTFFGMDPITISEIASRLDTIQARLLPLVRPSSMTEFVSVGFSFDEIGDSNVHHNLFVSLPSSLASNATVLSTSEVAFALSEIDFDCVVTKAGLDHVQESIKEWLVRIPVINLYDEFPDRSSLHDFLRIAFNLEGLDVQGRVQKVHASRDSMSDHAFAAVCSALPHTQSVRCFKYDDEGLRFVSRDRDWSWLGYALYHPDAKLSTWRELNLHMIGVTRNLPAILRTMSAGNNLLALLSKKPANSNAYFSASLRPHSKFYASSRQEKQEGDGENVFLWTSGDAEGAYDVCVASTDVTSLDQFVGTIVPGLGLVYTSRANIIEITSRPPAAVPCLTAFEAFPKYSGEFSLEQVPEMLGANLEHLDLRTLLSPRGPELRRLLSSMPHLKSLGMNDNGQLWRHHDEDNAPSLPCLRELKLWLREHQPFVPFSQAAFKTSLRDLSALSINVRGSGLYTPFVLHTVLTSLPSLQYLHCEKGWTSPNRRVKSYLRSRHRTYERICFGSSDEVAFAHRPVDLECRYALASLTSSVVSSSSAASRLNLDLLTHVLEFASTVLPREICIQDWCEDAMSTLP